VHALVSPCGCAAAYLQPATRVAPGVWQCKECTCPGHRRHDERHLQQRGAAGRAQPAAGGPAAAGARGGGRGCGWRRRGGPLRCVHRRHRLLAPAARAAAGARPRGSPAHGGPAHAARRAHPACHGCCGTCAVQSQFLLRYICHQVPVHAGAYDPCLYDPCLWTTNPTTNPTSNLLLAQGDDAEAARVVFFGWPGHLETSEPPGPPMYGGAAELSGCGGGAGNGGLNGSCGSSAGTPRLGGAPSQAQAPRELRERRRAPGSRQLACAGLPTLPFCPASSSRQQDLQSLQQSHVTFTRCGVMSPGTSQAQRPACWVDTPRHGGRQFAHAAAPALPHVSDFTPCAPSALTNWRATRGVNALTRWRAARAGTS